MSASPSRASRLPEPAAVALVGAFESATAAVILHASPRRERSILHAVAAIIVVALAFISVVKLDRVVTATGRIEPVEGNIFVQPYDKAIIREIRVKPGDIVHQGDVLASLDPTFAAADEIQLDQKLASTSALVVRLEAEQADRPYVADNNPYETLQRSIWRQRQSEYQQSIADFDAQIRSATTAVARAQEGAEAYGKRAGIAVDIERMNATLEEHGWGSKLKTRMATDQRLEAQRLLTDNEHQIKQSQHDLDALKAKQAVFIGKWQDDLATALVTARNDRDAAEQGVVKAHKLRELVDVMAPRDAVVLKIANASTGSVTSDGQQAAEPLFTLVPLDGPVEADVEIDAQDNGFIAAGDPVEIKLEAYKFMRHGTTKGKVKTVSEGSFTVSDTQQPRAPYFRARIAITELHLHDVPQNFRLIPGMTLTADIIVGRRSLMSYLVEGALRTSSEAMREP
jgi:HlyD family type I secretion membrane fusion protein